ncbi:unnamed protein product [Phyllotreta striolata]|uniref:Kinesin-like protein n=1 Tax=Phyllotreta striolata TaxID=444603 RepID=A0A9N9THU5_PHYSR|nr:unnamed protein product [Phyllotreta striolata]
MIISFRIKFEEMTDQTIKVYARIRKTNDKNSEQYLIQQNNDYEEIIFANSGISTLQKICRFHKVFDAKTPQSEIFEVVAKPVIISVIEGFNGTIFAYGQTGSGKTYALNGCTREFSQRGIIPRSIEYIFNHYNNIAEEPTIYISYMEIYNEIGYDLLSTKQYNVTRTPEELPRVSVMEDKKGDPHIKNLSTFPVTNEEDAKRLLFMGDTNRTIAETPYNEFSSRSHCIFTFYITHCSTKSKLIRSSKLHLVDLAGSERDFKTNVNSIVHEAKFINLSLYFLQQVIIALSESKRSHIPYRNSMLTHLLKDSLNGNCITVMLATLSVNKENFQETLSTCRFAQRVSTISTSPTVNEICDPEKEIEFLKLRIRNLETQLSDSKDFSSSNVLSVRQKENCEAEVRKFINSDEKPIRVEADMTQIQFCFDLLRKELDKQRTELRTMEKLVTQKKTEITGLVREIRTKDSEIERLKVEIERVPDDPIKMLSIIPTASRNNKNQLESILIKANNKPPDDYKTALQNQLNLAKKCSDTIEHCKRKIIVYRSELEHSKRTPRDKQELVKKLEEQQRIYKAELAELKRIQADTARLEAAAKQSEINTVNKFDDWFKGKDSGDSPRKPPPQISNNNKVEIDNTYTVRDTKEIELKLLCGGSSNESLKGSGSSESSLKDVQEPVVKEKPEDSTAQSDQNGFTKYFNASDSADFKEFMKSVSSSGVDEVDEEIVNFYRSKF